MTTKEDDSLIKIEALEKEYASLLSQYEEAFKNYQDTLNTKTGKEMIAVNGRTWWGQTALKEGPAGTQNECIAMCSANDKCTGATFNSEKKYCWARAGDDILTPGNDNDVALIPKIKMNVITLSQLNNRLIDVNMKMSNEFKNLNPKLKAQKIQQEKKQKELNKAYIKLSEDKKNMNNILNEYNSVEKDYENQTLNVNRANTLFKLWTLFACIVILILYKTLVGDGLPNSAMFFVVLMIITIFTLNLNLWSLLIVVLIVALIKVLLS